jgi:S1-C subfamily serine protease
VRKLLGLGVIFMIGFMFGAWVLMTYYPRTVGVSSPADQANLIHVLDAPAKSALPPTSFETMFSNASKQIAPAVVNIDVAGSLQTFWGTQEVSGKGSGVIISADGYAVTNNHVVRLPNRRVADSIQVTLSDGRQFKATVIGTDARNDIALIKIQGTKLPVADLGNSDTLKVGDWVVAVGNPFGLENTVTAGIVSALNRNITTNARVPSGLIQTDASINAGNSGGALANSRGQLIGINTLILSPSGPEGGNVGIGFAIPINLVKNIVKELSQGGSIGVAWMGVSFGDVSDPNIQTLLKNHFPDTQIPQKGVVLTRIMRGGPAHEAGLEPGDILTTLNGKPIQSNSDVEQFMRKAKSGETVRFNVWREGKQLDATIRLGEAPY